MSDVPSLCDDAFQPSGLFPELHLHKSQPLNQVLYDDSTMLVSGNWPLVSHYCWSFPHRYTNLWSSYNPFNNSPPPPPPPPPKKKKKIQSYHHRIQILHIITLSSSILPILKCSHPDVLVTSCLLFYHLLTRVVWKKQEMGGGGGWGGGTLQVIYAPAVTLHWAQTKTLHKRWTYNCPAPNSAYPSNLLLCSVRS